MWGLKLHVEKKKKRDGYAKKKHAPVWLISVHWQHNYWQDFHKCCVNKEVFEGQ